LSNDVNNGAEPSTPLQRIASALHARHQTRCIEVAQLNAQRQCIDEHAEDLLNTCVALQASKQYCAEDDVIAAARLRDDQRPAGMK
jgi:hypothetical protein